MSKILFQKFNSAVDSFDFTLKKRNGIYQLVITASSRGRILEKSVIVLETGNLELAIKKALKVLNRLAREIAPGIMEQGNLITSNTRIVPGIKLVEVEEEDDDYEDDYYDCDEDYCNCEEEYECRKDRLSPSAREFINALSNIVDFLKKHR